MPHPIVPAGCEGVFRMLPSPLSKNRAPSAGHKVRQFRQSLKVFVEQEGKAGSILRYKATDQQIVSCAEIKDTSASTSVPEVVPVVISK